MMTFRSMIGAFFAAAALMITPATMAEERGTTDQIVVAALDVQNVTAPVVDPAYEDFRNSVIIDRILDDEESVASDVEEYSPMRLSHAADVCHKARCLPNCPRCGVLVRSARTPGLWLGHCKKGGVRYDCQVWR